MKIPHINRYNVAKAVVITRKKGKKLLNDATYIANEVGLEKEKVVSVLIAAHSITSHVQMPIERLTDSEILKAEGVIIPVPKQIGTGKRVKKLKRKVPSTAKNTKLMAKNVHINAPELKLKFENLLLENEHNTNPLHNKGGIFIAKARENGVNPVVMMAISLHESARGASNLTKTKHNIGGIMVKSGKHYVPQHFSNVDVCIDKIAKILKAHNTDSNISTVEELAYAGKYCAKDEANEWINGVMYYVNKLE